MKKKPIDYIDNKSLFNALVIYRQECLDYMKKLSEKDAEAAKEYEYMLFCKDNSDKAREVLDKFIDEFNNIVEKYSDELSPVEAYKIANQSNTAYDKLKEKAKIYSSAYAALAGAITQRPMTKTYSYIGKCFHQLTTRLMDRPNFSGYSWRNDMSSNAVMDCVARLNNFDPTKSENSFAYFSQISFNSAVRTIKMENQQRDLKISLLKNAAIMSEFTEGVDDDGESSGIRDNITSMLSCLEPVAKTTMESKHKKTNKSYQKKLKEIDEKVAIAEKELEDQPLSKFEEFYEEEGLQEELDETFE